MQKKKEVLLRHRFWNCFFKIFFKPILMIKYHFKYKKTSIKKLGPCLILANHSCAIDPIVLSFCFDRPIYYVSSEQIFNLGFLTKALLYIVNPISKSKSLTDFKSIKKIKTIINEGGAVGIFPEGNVPYNGKNPSMPLAIGKLVKSLNVPVLIFNSHGLYLSNPRWSIKRKYGRSWFEHVDTFNPLDYEKMSDSEIYEYLKNKLYVNCYEDQEKEAIKYKGIKRAEGLESFLFVCPKCHQLLTLESENNYLCCKSCDFKAIYDEYGYLIDNKCYKWTLVELSDLQKQIFRDYLINLENNDDIIFSDYCQMEISYPDKKIKKGNATISINSKFIEINCDKSLEQYLYEDILAVSIQGKHKLLVYVKDLPTILLNFSSRQNLYKYLLCYQFFKYKIQAKKGGNTNDIINISNMGLY